MLKTIFLTADLEQADIVLAIACIAELRVRHGWIDCVLEGDEGMSGKQMEEMIQVLQGQVQMDY